eukprot:1162136-Pelagomonas_calceolata.AAC.18
MADQQHRGTIMPVPKQRAVTRQHQKHRQPIAQRGRKAAGAARGTVFRSQVADYAGSKGYILQTKTRGKLEVKLLDREGSSILIADYEQ